MGSTDKLQRRSLTNNMHVDTTEWHSAIVLSIKEITQDKHNQMAGHFPAFFKTFSLTPGGRCWSKSMSSCEQLQISIKTRPYESENQLIFHQAVRRLRRRRFSTYNSLYTVGCNCLRKHNFVHILNYLRVKT